MPKRHRRQDLHGMSAHGIRHWDSIIEVTCDIVKSPSKPYIIVQDIEFHECPCASETSRVLSLCFCLAIPIFPLSIHIIFYLLGIYCFKYFMLNNSQSPIIYFHKHKSIHSLTGLLSKGSIWELSCVNYGDLSVLVYLQWTLKATLRGNFILVSLAHA